MSKLLDFYIHNNNNPAISNLATEYLLKDTIDRNLQKTNKLKDIDGMDMESNLHGKIVPGMIFTFQYKSLKNINDVIEQLNFGDNFPIVLCCGIKLFDKNINGKIKRTLSIQGLNLNMLSSEKRLKLLNTIHTKYLNFYENEIYNHVNNNTVAINNDLAVKLQDFNSLKSFLSITNDDLQLCFRTYDVSRCKNIRLIEYNLWKYIPFYNPKRYILNLSKHQIDQIMLLLNK